jgi:hypothetical protein
VAVAPKVDVARWGALSGRDHDDGCGSGKWSASDAGVPHDDEDSNNFKVKM